MRLVNALLAGTLFAGLGTVAITVAASAADLPRKAPAFAPAIATIYNWTGFYVGVHGGYATGDANSGLLGGSLDIEGGFGGAQLGFNWQAPGSPWVFGVEVDSSFADIQDSFVATVGGVTGSIESQIDYFGTARGRIGYAWDRFLVYGTGGVAWANNELTLGVAFPGFAAAVSNDQTHIGWTAGAGVEWAFAPNWSAKVEYLYMDFDSEDFFAGPAGSISADAEIHTIKIGVNYRFDWGQSAAPLRVRN